ncbi:oleosin G [Diospyros lotus]|uniref:oleosin G n=1 Tax=Diospyros lotus TaxID=55363 RepID=UPI002256435F|nr:oleosin G [Diospyros lotus]
MFPDELTLQTPVTKAAPPALSLSIPFPLLQFPLPYHPPPPPSPALKMSDRQGGSGQAPTRPPRPAAPTHPFLRRLHDHAPNSTQLLGFTALVVSGGILLLLTGLTITAAVLGLIFFTPLLVLSSPIWLPIGAVLFVAIAGFLSVCGFAVTVVAALSWMYRYFRGFHPPGSDRVDYARSRIADTASHVKDYAREYGGYLHSKVKDAAPGA